MGDLFLGEGCSCSIKKLKSEIFNDKKVGNFEKRELGQFSGLIAWWKRDCGVCEDGGW